jgi:hypothetical protein
MILPLASSPHPEFRGFVLLLEIPSRIDLSAKLEGKHRSARFINATTEMWHNTHSPA